MKGNASFTRKVLVVAFCFAAIAAVVVTPAASGASDRLVVETAAQLEAALVPQNAGRDIVLRAGTYLVDAALTVPDHATLTGAGVMLGSELPTGFQPGTESRIVAKPSVAGDLLTLGDGASVRRVTVEDVVDRSGNTVAVVSREAGGSVSASIRESLIVTPNPSGIGPAGPTGTGVVAVTRNPALGADPPPHVGARLEVEVRRSIVQAAGRAFFVTNFASGGKVRASLKESVVRGPLEAIAGISRPDAVSGALVAVESRKNLFTSPPGGPTTVGWDFGGGFSTPIAFGSPWAGASGNELRVDSRNDTIENAVTGILAIAAERPSPDAGLSSNNTIQLSVRELDLQTEHADLALHATVSRSGSTPADIPAGDGNVLKVDIRGSTGSGPRSNAYAHTVGPTPANAGVGNRLVIEDTLDRFLSRNTGFVPPPPAEFFSGT